MSDAVMDLASYLAISLVVLLWFGAVAFNMRRQAGGDAGLARRQRRRR